MTQPYVIFQDTNDLIISFGRTTSLPILNAGLSASFVPAAELDKITAEIADGYWFNEPPDPAEPSVQAYWQPPFINISLNSGILMPVDPQTVRDERNDLLLQTDWTQLPDVALSAASVSAFATYRQALRDVPQQSGFPGTVNWPARPTESNA